MPISIQYCNSVCLKSGQGSSTNAVKSDAKWCLASALLKQIKISCYTEYIVFGPVTNLQYYHGNIIHWGLGIRTKQGYLNYFTFVRIPRSLGSNSSDKICSDCESLKGVPVSEQSGYRDQVYFFLVSHRFWAKGPNLWENCICIQRFIKDLNLV